MNAPPKFKRDYKREAGGPHRTSLDRVLSTAVTMLARDEQLPARWQDHSLAGEWQDHRDSHLRPDLVLIHRKPSPTVLQLVRLGSHSELGL